MESEPGFLFCGGLSEEIDMRAIKVAAMATSRADPGTVFRLLKDPVTWPLWGMFVSGELQRPGDSDRLGVGAVRVFRTRVSVATEEVVELVPDRRLSYVLLSGLPLRDYRADVDLAPLPDGGTSIGWQSSFDVQYPGTGWFWRMVISRVLKGTAQSLAAGAEDPAIVAAVQA
jgi:Polyketide cyclase / dehydrase and lipid transport